MQHTNAVHLAPAEAQIDDHRAWGGIGQCRDLPQLLGQRVAVLLITRETARVDAWAPPWLKNAPAGEA